ncbi:MAG TPA: rhamnulokinase family protein [Galbitalea sp.]|jgi:rhamnulokinase|nr:rhamnulokinase family protein [Galbitalea sp.]
MTRVSVAAVDLGATSGRVMVGHVGPNSFELNAVARFRNTPIRENGELHWNMTGLYGSVLEGLATALAEQPELASVGVDSWGLDYGLIRDGVLLQQPFHYRDDRTPRGLAEVRRHISDEELYAHNGLQIMSINSIYQLSVDRMDGRLQPTDTVLLIPDVVTHLLTGQSIAEQTNASTSGLLNVTSGKWDDELMRKIDLPRTILPELVGPGIAIGPVTDTRLANGARLTLTTVGSHDTASAVVAVPATSPDFAYISCGTWGLVGVETEHPVLTKEALAARFTNEGGVDGRVRFLHNVMGLWILTETIRGWGDDLAPLLAAARDVSENVSIFDVDDERFLPPGDMPTRIATSLTERGLPVPSSKAEIVRTIIESLAQAFADSVAKASRLSGTKVSVVHLVGGGSQNELLCQSTADRTGLPVLAGPMEATAMGNVLVQARALGATSPGLDGMRALVAANFAPRRYVPAS